MNKVLFVFFGLIIFVSCSSIEEPVDKKIKGFWTVNSINDSNLQVQEMYVEINDSVLLYWEEDIFYLPPYGYTINENDTMFNWLNDKPEAKIFPFGRVEIISDNEFTISNFQETFYYKKSSFEVFKQKNGFQWLNDPQ